eukprot:3847120-Ditylum_brightwellii.AAC.1
MECKMNTTAVTKSVIYHSTEASSQHCPIFAGVHIFDFVWGSSISSSFESKSAAGNTCYSQTIQHCKIDMTSYDRKGKTEHGRKSH